jgi:hypothetical protein
MHCNALEATGLSDEEDETKHLSQAMSGAMGQNLNSPANQPSPSTTENPTDLPQQNPNDPVIPTTMIHTIPSAIYWRPSQSCPKPPQMPDAPRIGMMERTKMITDPPMTYLQPLFFWVMAGRKAQAPTTYPIVVDRPQVRLGVTEER